MSILSFRLCLATAISSAVAVGAADRADAQSLEKTTTVTTRERPELDPLGIRRMKKSIVQRARSGCAVVLSSHLLHLLEEVCTHVLILKRGAKIANGTLADVAAEFDPPHLAARIYEGLARLYPENAPFQVTAGKLDLVNKFKGD